MGELQHQLLPMSAATQVSLVKASDVLNDLLPFYALSKIHVLSDVCCNFGNVGYNVNGTTKRNPWKGTQGIIKRVTFADVARFSLCSSIS